MQDLQVFLVEDNLLLQETLVGALEELAPVHVVATAVDEPDAVIWLREHLVDLVIIDVFLITGSGLGVLASAAAMKHAAKLVVLSNYTNSTMRSRCLELGAEKIFDKSTELDELVEYCHQLAHSSIRH